MLKNRSPYKRPKNWKTGEGLECGHENRGTRLTIYPLQPTKNSEQSVTLKRSKSVKFVAGGGSPTRNSMKKYMDVRRGEAELSIRSEIQFAEEIEMISGGNMAAGSSMEEKKE